MKKICLIDGNYNIIRSLHKAKTLDLENSKNEPIGGLFLFLKALYTMRSLGDIHLVVLDSDHAKFRKQLFPEYKVKSKKTEEEKTDEEKEFDVMFKYTFEEVHKLLPKMGIPVVQLEGEEADDVIYCITKELYKKNNKIYVVSDDEDYLQFLRFPDVVIYQAMKNDYWNRDRFVDEFKFDIKFFPFYKAMVGDTSDKIKGVKGIGPKGATQVIEGLKEPTIENMYEWCSLGDKAIHKKMKEQFGIFKRNLLLMDLENIPNYDTFKNRVYKCYSKAMDISQVDYEFVFEYFKEKEFRSLSYWLTSLIQ